MKRILLLLGMVALGIVPVQGQRFMRTLPTLDALLASNPRDVHTNVFVQGRSSPNDGFQGTFYFVNGSSFSTNLGTVFATRYTGASGRWFRLVDGMYNVRWFGAVGDGSTDDYVALTNAMVTAGLDEKGLFFPNRGSDRGDYATSKPLIMDGIRAMWKGESSWTRITHLEGDDYYHALIQIKGAPYQHRIEDLEIQGSAHITNAIHLHHVAQSYFAHVKARDAIERGWFITESVLNQFDTISCTQPGLFLRIPPKIGIHLATNSNANLINNSITENLNTNDVYGAGIWIDGGSRNNVIMDGSSEFNYWGIYITNALCTTIMGIDMESNFAVDDVIDAGKFSQYINVLATKQLRLASPNRMSKVQGGQFGNIVIDSGVAGAILENVAYDILNNGGTITDNGTGTAILQSQHTPTDARTGFNIKSGISTPVMTLALNGAQDPTIEFYRSTAGVDEKRWRIFQTSANGDLRIEALSDDGLTSSAALRITRSGVNISELIVPNGNLQVDANLQVGGDSGARIASGPGDPEGAQALPVGSLWLRTDAGLATGVYRKLAGGTSNTGWYAVSISPSITTDASHTFVSSHADGVYMDLFHNDASPLHRYIRQQDGQLQFISDGFGAVTHRFSNEGYLGTEGVTPSSGVHVKTFALVGAATAVDAEMGTNATVIVVSAASQTITLPEASTVSGRVYIVKNAAAATSTTVDVSGGGNIDSGTTDTLSSGGDSQAYWSDASQWWKIAGGTGGGGGGGTDDQTAAEVPFTPAGSLAADDVQEALEELDFDIENFGEVSNDPYGPGWNGDTNNVPSLDVVYDAIEALGGVADDAYDATAWNGVTTEAPSKNAVRDALETLSVGGGLTTTDIDTSAELRGILTDETGTGAAVFADSPTFADDITIQATGVRLTGDGDGALTILGLGNGSDEDLTINLDDTSNTAVVSSSTGLNNISLSSIDLTVPTEAYDATGWNGDNTVPTKDAVRDKIESLSSGGMASSELSTNYFDVRGTPGAANSIVYKAADPELELSWLNHFVGTTFANVQDDPASSVANSGTVTIATFAGIATNRMGIVQLQTVTSASSRAAIIYGSASMNQFFLGTGGARFKTAIYIQTLSDASNEYALRIGWGDSNSADFSDGLYFEYDRTVSANWQVKSAKGASRDAVVTTTAVAAGTWIVLECIYNRGGASAQFYINGTEVTRSSGDTYPIASDLPSAVGDALGWVAHFVRSAGTTERNVWIDYVLGQIRYDAP